MLRWSTHSWIHCAFFYCISESTLNAFLQQNLLRYPADVYTWALICPEAFATKKELLALDTSETAICSRCHAKWDPFKLRQVATSVITCHLLPQCDGLPLKTLLFSAVVLIITLPTPELFGWKQYSWHHLIIFKFHHTAPVPISHQFK